MELLLLKLLNGLTTGALYAVIAFGLTFILGMLNIPNFAHGALFALGGYVGYTLLQQTGSYWIALVAAPLVLAAFGAALERGFLRPLYGRDPEDENYLLLALFALAIILQEVIIMIWGAAGESGLPPQILAGAAPLGPIYYPKFRLFVLGSAALIVLLSWLFIERTRAGALIKAAIENRDAVMLLGVDIRILFAASFAFGTFLTALAGVLSLPIRGVHPFIGMDILAISFVIVVVGGLGNLYGAIFAGLLVGVLQEFATLIHPLASWLAVYLTMMVVLLVRPKGLFGQR
ncbi:branched-chain amino acid ABC transporter permease [Rhodoligotrophos defluvii]|uniref:branched-chain amino acid ABC transporter permease n=1 Tax=Rhodoligotrophos defluvii TaxID=2561934 RepID=UPI001484EA31|nr:branched-chain amino acid ABC transporter permease [Rhodoligotrophos defluvii]